METIGKDFNECFGQWLITLRDVIKDLWQEKLDHNKGDTTADGSFDTTSLSVKLKNI